MLTGKNSKYVIYVALLALACGPAAVYAQGAKSPAGSAGEGSTGKSSSSAQESQSSTGAGATASSPAASTGSRTLSSADQRLMKEMAQANIAEIEAGKLAQKKSKNDEVKNFAQRMIDDHTKALQDLQQIAQAKGITLPTSPDLKHQAMMTAMNLLSGDRFDRRYMTRDGLTDHRKTHQLLERAQRSSDPDLKQAATQTLPVVEQHLQMAQQLQASLKSGGTSAGASGTSGTTGAGSGSQGSTPGK